MDCRKLCVLMKFVDIVDPSIKEVKTKLLELFLELGEFKPLLRDLKIPVTNVIGMALDGASVIVGKNNSFTSRLVNDIKNAVEIITCVILSQ